MRQCRSTLRSRATAASKQLKFDETEHHDQKHSAGTLLQETAESTDDVNITQQQPPSITDVSMCALKQEDNMSSVVDSDVNMPLSMSCDVVDTDNDPWMLCNTDTDNSALTVITPSKLRTSSKSKLCDMPQLSKETVRICKASATVSHTEPQGNVATTVLGLGLVVTTAPEMPVLVKEPDADCSHSTTQCSYNLLQLSKRCRRRLGNTKVADRCYSYDTREWKVPKLTIRRRRSSGGGSRGAGGHLNSLSPSSASTSSEVGNAAAVGHGVVYEILRDTETSHDGNGPVPDESSRISPAQFYKRLRLKVGGQELMTVTDIDNTCS
jgi:hypothetical protein